MLTSKKASPSLITTEISKAACYTFKQSHDVNKSRNKNKINNAERQRGKYSTTPTQIKFKTGQERRVYVGEVCQVVVLACSWVEVREFVGWLGAPTERFHRGLDSRQAPTPACETAGLVLCQLPSPWLAPGCQVTDSGNLMRETTPAERVKTVISREGWAASPSAAVITAGAVTRVA